MLLLKKVKDPVIDLCAPPVKDITYANGRTGEIKGPVTSVISSNKSAGKFPIAHLIGYSEFGRWLVSHVGPQRIRALPATGIFIS